MTIEQTLRAALAALALHLVGCDMAGQPAQLDDAGAPDGGGRCAAYYTACIDFAGQALSVDLERIGSEQAWAVYDQHRERCAEGRAICKRWPDASAEAPDG